MFNCSSCFLLFWIEKFKIIFTFLRLIVRWDRMRNFYLIRCRGMVSFISWAYWSLCAYFLLLIKIRLWYIFLILTRGRGFIFFCMWPVFIWCRIRILIKKLTEKTASEVQKHNFALLFLYIFCCSSSEKLNLTIFFIKWKMPAFV